MDPLNLSDPAKIKAAATYNSTSDHFDDAPLAFWERYGTRTIERLGLLPGSTVLDVGCGTGASALPAAEIVGSSGTVVGVDLAEKLLARAQVKAMQRNLHNVEFQLADMMALNLPDATFDAVVSVFSIFFIPDMVSAVKELWRMTKPGGKLAITTWGPNLYEPIYAIWQETVRRVRPDLFNAFHPWDRIHTPEQLRRLMEDSGIALSEITQESGVQVFQSPQDWWLIVLGSGLRGTVDAMDSETIAEVRDTTVQWVRDNHVMAMQTNVMYAVATK